MSHLKVLNLITSTKSLLPGKATYSQVSETGDTGIFGSPLLYMPHMLSLTEIEWWKLGSNSVVWPQSLRYGGISPFTNSTRTEVKTSGRLSNGAGTTQSISHMVHRLPKNFSISYPTAHETLCYKESFNIMGACFHDQLEKGILQASNTKMKLLWSHRLVIQPHFEETELKSIFVRRKTGEKQGYVNTKVSAITKFGSHKTPPNLKDQFLNLTSSKKLHGENGVWRIWKNKAWNLQACDRKKRGLSERGSKQNYKIFTNKITPGSWKSTKHADPSDLTVHPHLMVFSLISQAIKWRDKMVRQTACSKGMQQSGPGNGAWFTTHMPKHRQTKEKPYSSGTWFLLLFLCININVDYGRLCCIMQVHQF